MKWTRALVVTGYRPTKEEALLVLNAGGMWIRKWRGGTCIVSPALKTIEDGRLGEMLWCDTILTMPETWRAINPDGSPVLVPCTREEALEAAGWRALEDVDIESLLKEEYWQFGFNEADKIVLTFSTVSASENGFELYVADLLEDLVSAVICRPVNAVGDYEPKPSKET